jgi:DNA-binding NarL/FixJ family response regulator
LRPTRILLADDHALVRRGVRMILDAEPDLSVVAEAGDGFAAVEAADATGVDIALLDVSMPRMTGVQAARELRRRKPGVAVVLLSMHASEQHLCEALRAGATGYVLKSAVDRELVDACRESVTGDRFVWPSAVDAAARARVEAATAGDGGDPGALSTRELEVLRLIADGASGREIAGELFISEKTVDRHRANIFGKLGVHDRVELTRHAIRTGLIEA